MRVQKKSTTQRDWAKARVDYNDGDIIIIKNAGEEVEGDYGTRLVFAVDTKNGEKHLSFNQTTINNLIDAYGEETSQWVGKEVKVWIIKSNIQGKLRDVTYLTAPDWRMLDEGFFPPPPNNQEPTITQEGYN